MPTPPSLQALSFDALLANVVSMTGEHVSALPEHVQLELFEGVLARGALNETVLGIFQEAATLPSLEIKYLLKFQEGVTPVSAVSFL